MRRILFALVLLFPIGPAYADNEPCSEEGACQNRSGDCRETEKGAHCEDNDLSPSFQDSPVDHSFNPVICLPGSTCNVGSQNEPS
jgi:hypothetical protein